MSPWPLLLPFLTIAATAQYNSAARHPTGAITGHIYCGDTNAPARMASVQLDPIKGPKRSGASRISGDVPAGGVAQTGFDGSFTLSRVSPGSYYVITSKPGYLSTRPDDDNEAEPTPP